MANFINCTPHNIVFRPATGEDIIFEPSGHVARVATKASASYCLIGGVPVHNPDEPGAVSGLPEPTEGAFLIVSALVGAALKGRRSDLVCPGTGPEDGALRNDKGHIVAVTRLKFP